jgi:hypothetical protein
MPKVAPRQNFELCPGATGRNALIFWDRESWILRTVQWHTVVCRVSTYSRYAP